MHCASRRADLRNVYTEPCVRKMSATFATSASGQPMPTTDAHRPRFPIHIAEAIQLRVGSQVA